MKEQVITPRMSSRGASGGKSRAGGIVQKPARRDRGASGSRASSGGTLRKVLDYLPLAGKVLLAVLTGVLLFAGYRAAASASFFQARNIDINSTTRANADEINRIVRHAATRTGVWRLDLSEVSAELERLPWVRKAVVSRVLPDGLRVRVTERTPLAVVRMSNGKIVWVDEDAVTLGAMSPTDRMPTFFIRGWDEASTPEAQAENRERIEKYLALAREWDAAGLSERVSEVNLADVRDVRAQLAGDDSQIEVRLGSKDFGPRLRRALGVLDEKRNTPNGPFITRLETLENRTIIGTSSGTNVSSENMSETAAPTETAATTPKRRETESASAPRKAKRATDENKKKEKEQRAKKEQDKKEQAKVKTKGETRPRRVG